MTRAKSLPKLSVIIYWAMPNGAWHREANLPAAISKYLMQWWEQDKMKKSVDLRDADF